MDDADKRFFEFTREQEKRIPFFTAEAVAKALGSRKFGPSAKTRAAMKTILNQFTVTEHLAMLKEELENLSAYEPEGEERKDSRRHFRDALHAAQYEVAMIRKLLKAKKN